MIPCGAPDAAMLRRSSAGENFIEHACITMSRRKCACAAIRYTTLFSE
jgi:hypothetical protein